MDIFSGGSLVDKTPEAPKSLIENTSINFEQFTNKSNSMALKKNDNELRATDHSKLESWFDEIIELVEKFVVGKTQTTRVCGICVTN